MVGAVRDQTSTPQGAAPERHISRVVHTRVILHRARARGAVDGTMAAILGALTMSLASNSSASGNSSARRQPHLLYILADDFGWADADWHRPKNWPEAATPRMLDQLTRGIELDSMHAFKFCAPSRSAIQSGRNPIHVNVQNYQPTVWASDVPQRDPVSGFAGIPRNMTGMAAMLRTAGYHTAFVGKWDCGMATYDHTPSGRGYDTSLFYCEQLRPYTRCLDCTQPAHVCAHLPLPHQTTTTTTTGPRASAPPTLSGCAPAQRTSWSTCGMVTALHSASTTRPRVSLRMASTRSHPAASLTPAAHTVRYLRSIEVVPLSRD